MAELNSTGTELEKHWFDKECPKTEYQPTRAKNWVLVLYPEDVPEGVDWVDELRKLQFATAISPLHNMDVNPDGERKKAHHHIILAGKGTCIGYKTLQEFGKLVRAVALPQKCSNVEGYTRYLVHADNPEKYQYSKADIQIIGRFDIEKAFKSTTTENWLMTADMMDYIEEENITEFADLMLYARHNREDWFVFLCTSAWTIEKFITSRRNKQRQKYKDTESKMMIEVIENQNKLLEQLETKKSEAR